MMWKHTSERGGERWRPRARDVGCVLVSTVAFSEASIAFVFGGFDYHHWRYVQLILVASAMLAAMCYLVGLLLVQLRRGTLRGNKGAANLAVGLVVAMGILSLEMIRYVEAPTRPFWFLQVIIAISASIALSILITPRILSSCGKDGRLWVIIGCALPWLSLENMIFAWYHQYRLSGFSDLSLRGGGSDFLFVFLILITLWAVTKLGKRWTMRANVLLAISIVLSPFLANLAGARVAATKGHGVSRVILITIDALRRDRLSCYSEAAPPTPAIDALAAHAVRFDHAHAAAPWTLPSFASIMTGYPVIVHGTRWSSSRLPSSFETLAQQLRSAGYRTAAMGNNPYLAPRWGFARGFDEYRFYPRRLGPSLAIQAARKVWPEAFSSQITSQEIAQKAIHWIRRHKKEDFFLWIHFLDPHQPYAPPPEFWPDEKPPMGLSWAFEAPAKGDLFNDFNPPPYRRRWIEALYDGEVRYVDCWVGKLFKALHESGLYDESLIVLTSDHGEEFWEHGAWEHCHTLYEELLRVPLLLKPPRASSGRVVEHPVSLTALYATMLDYCGLKIPISPLLDGSLRPLVEGEADVGAHLSRGREKPLLASGIVRRPDALALLFSRYKYIWWPGTGEERLYDLDSDPGEKKPLPPGDYEAFLRMARAEVDSLFEIADSLRSAYQVGKGAAEELDRASLEKLRALGYIR